jgi:predicted ATPase
MLIQSIDIKGLLSFKDASLEMRPLNVLIGPNASGKSNFLEILALLRALPRDLPEFFRRSGGVAQWFWNGGDGASISSGTLETCLRLNSISPATLLRYSVQVSERSHEMTIKNERLEETNPNLRTNPYPYLFDNKRGFAHIVSALERTAGQRLPEPPSEYTHFAQSILHERKDPSNYPELSSLAGEFDKVALFRESNMGRTILPRKPQGTDEPTTFVSEDFRNLALVVNKLQLTPTITTIEGALRRFNQSFERVQVQIDGGTALLMIREKGLDIPIPATRLSDGTLRFLALLTILCHPEPPPLICIEEPELGLHPDIIPVVAELLRSASERTQLVVTTHSKRLIDEFSDEPESVVVCERDPEEGTQFRRLSKDDLDVWLERYELGELWEKGEIGGNRW